jgi:flagellar protein FliS
MNRFGAQAYQRVGVDTGVTASDPHALVLMLFDGVLESIKHAQGHVAAGRVLEKGKALSKAVRIVEEGLKASLDRNSGGALAQQLAALYDYASLRLLQANLRNDHKALAEVASLLSDLRTAWAAIGAKAPAPEAAPAQPAVRGPAAANGEPAPGRRLAMTA